MYDVVVVGSACVPGDVATDVVICGFIICDYDEVVDVSCAVVGLCSVVVVGHVVGVSWCSNIVWC